MSLPHPTRFPAALDLFCCGGGAGEGLRQVFATVIGIDCVDHSSSYAQNGKQFVCHDALTLPVEYIRRFEFVWASPPCQFACTIIPRRQREKHEARWQQQRGAHINHIPAIRNLLTAAGVPFAIENVQGARHHLHSPIRLCGTMFGLRVYRHRFIECNGFAAGIPRACDHRNSGIGALAGKVTPIKTERYATDDVAAHRAGFEDDSFAAKRVVYPSRNGTTRVDYVYVGKTTAITSMIHDAYKRNFCRSVKEVLRLTDQLRHLTADELQAERERYAQESKARLPEGARQFYPVYGLSKKRGSNEEWTEALGLDVDLTRHELRESVPPAFSRCIAQQFIDGGAVTPTPSRR